MFKIEGSFGERWVGISGGRIVVDSVEGLLEKVEEVDDSFGTISQLFEAPRIAGEKHLLHASKLALEALEKDRSFADSPSIELTCWAAGLRQINKSLDRVGIKSNSEKVAIITIGESSSDVRKAMEELIRALDLEQDEEVLDVTPEKIDILRDSFSISSNRLETAPLQELILEKVALLSLEK